MTPQAADAHPIPQLPGSRLLLLVKAAHHHEGMYSHGAGYFLHQGRWHKIGASSTPQPKSAPVAHNPGKHAAAPKEHLAATEWQQLQLPDSNTNAATFNAALAKLKEWSDAGNVAAILGAQYGTNTYGKKLATIANHLLALHGSEHKVTAGQKPGEHVAVKPDEASAAPAPQEAAAPAAPPPPAPEPAPAAEEPTPTAAALDETELPPLSPSVFGSDMIFAGKVADAAMVGDIETVEAALKHAEKTYHPHSAASGAVLEYVKAVKQAMLDKGADGGAAPAPKPAPAPTPASKEEMDAAFEQTAGPSIADLKAGGQLPALAMPAFHEGKTTTGVVAYYEKVAKKVIDHAEAGNVAVLEDMKADGLKPKNGKVSNTWAGKTANSKMLLDLHAKALAHAKGGTTATGKGIPQAELKAAAARSADKPGTGEAAASALDKLTSDIASAGTEGKAQMLASQYIGQNQMESWAYSDAIDALQAAGFSKVAETIKKLKAVAEGTHEAPADGWPEKPTGGEAYSKIVSSLEQAAKSGDMAALNAVIEEHNLSGEQITDAAKKLKAYASALGAKVAEKKPATPDTGPLTADQLGKLQSIPWHTLKLPDSNTNAPSVNKKLKALQDAAFAGDIAAIEAMTWGANTYNKKLSLAAQAAVAALKEGAAPAAQAAPEPAADAQLTSITPEQHSTIMAWLNDDNFDTPPELMEGAQLYGQLSEELKKKLVKEQIAHAKAKDAAQAALKGKPAIDHITDAYNALPAGATAGTAFPAIKGAAADWLAANPGAWDEVNEALKESGYGMMAHFGPDSPAMETGPKDGDTKPGANGGTLVFKDGRWHKQQEDIHPNAKATLDSLVASGSWSDIEVFAEPDTQVPEAVKDYAKQLLAQKHGPSKPTAAQKQEMISAKLAGKVFTPEHQALWNTLDEGEKQWMFDEMDKQQAGAAAAPAPAPAAHPVDAVEMPDFIGLGGSGLDATWNARYLKIAQHLQQQVKEHGADGLKGKVINHKDGSFTINAAGFSLKSIAPNGVQGSVQLKRRSLMHKFITDLKAAAGKPVKKPKAASTANAAAPAAAPGGMPSMDDWTQTGGQGGSNPGGKFKDPSGQEWYCKFPPDSDHAKSEVLAAKLYQLAGLHAQDAMLVTKGGKIGIASKWNDLTFAPDKLAGSEGAQAGFAVDAWLANYDVVGPDFKNMQLDGVKAFRLDAGGSLEYRAQGKKKTDFGNEVKELESMRNPSINPATAKVFGSMTEADITASVAKVLAISDVAIRAYVNQFGPGDAAAKKKLADTLIARKADLAKKFPAAAKAKKKVVFDPGKISSPPSFTNWGGSGKSGPSSKEFLNKANEEAVQAIFAAAKTGDPDAIKSLKLKVFNKETGQVIGEASALEHPSQHVKGFAQQALNEINYQLNPPKKFRFEGGHPLHALNAAYPSHSGSLTSPSVQKLGKFVLLGEPGTLNLGDIGMPQKVLHTEAGGTLTKSTYTKAAQDAVGKMPLTQLQAIQSYTGSGYHQINNSLWTGNPSGAAESAGQALKTLGHDIAPGTVLSRKVSLSGQALNEVLGSAGKILQEPAIMSTSIRPSSWSGNVHLKLHVGPGVKGLWVGPGSKPGGGAISNHAGEDEMILPPGTRLLILSVKKSTGKDADGFGGSSEHVIEAVILPTE